MEFKSKKFSARAVNTDIIEASALAFLQVINRIALWERYQVNRVLPTSDLERETYAWAGRVAENSPEALRMAKIQMNKAQDAQGFSQAVEDSLGDYVAMMWMPGGEMRVEGVKRLATVDLAVRGRRGERYGLTPAKT